MAGFGDAEYWTAADGARLLLRRQPAHGSRRAALILVHGFGEHSARYAHVAGWLADHGVTVFALDQRGAGRSPGRRGHIAKFAQYLSDIVALRRLVEAEAPGPLLLLGHSHGGLVVLRYLETAPTGVAGAIVSSPFLGPAQRLPRWKNALARVLADVAPAVPIKTGMNLAYLSTDPAVGEAVRSDPLCHQVMSPRCWRETQDAWAALQAEWGRIAVAILFLLAGDDRISSSAVARDFAERLPGDVVVKQYEGFFHEVLNEPSRGAVLADIEAWLDRIAPSSAAAPARRA